MNIKSNADIQKQDNFIHIKTITKTISFKRVKSGTEWTIVSKKKISLKLWKLKSEIIKIYDGQENRWTNFS